MQCGVQLVVRGHTCTVWLPVFVYACTCTCVQCALWGGGCRYRVLVMGTCGCRYRVLDMGTCGCRYRVLVMGTWYIVRGACYAVHSVDRGWHSARCEGLRLYSRDFSQFSYAVLRILYLAWRTDQSHYVPGTHVQHPIPCTLPAERINRLKWHSTSNRYFFRKQLLGQTSIRGTS